MFQYVSICKVQMFTVQKVHNADHLGSPIKESWYSVTQRQSAIVDGDLFLQTGSHGSDKKAQIMEKINKQQINNK